MKLNFGPSKAINYVTLLISNLEGIPGNVSIRQDSFSDFQLCRFNCSCKLASLILLDKKLFFASSKGIYYVTIQSLNPEGIPRNISIRSNSRFAFQLARNTWLRKYTNYIVFCFSTWSDKPFIRKQVNKFYTFINKALFRSSQINLFRHDIFM